MSKAVFKTNLQIWIWLEDFSSVDYGPVAKSQSKRKKNPNFYVSVSVQKLDIECLMVWCSKSNVTILCL